MISFFAQSSRALLLLVLSIAVFVSAPLTLQAQTLKSAGTLTCLATGAEGFVFNKTREIDCTFEPTIAELKKAYFKGRVSKFGERQLGTSKTLVVWQVLWRGEQLQTNELQGYYRSAEPLGIVPGSPGSLTHKVEGKVVLKPLTRGVGATGNSAVNVVEIELTRVRVKA